jgi:hypothetical protein
MLIALAITPGNPVLNNGWTPLRLGSSLLAWWDSAYGVSLSGSAVTAWADRKNGYSAAQGTGSLRPVFSATSFNGVPGLTFDGTDDYLELASQPFPSGANPCEIWSVVSQDALVADTGVRAVFSYGGDASTARRGVERSVVTGQNRVRVTQGDGTTGFTVTVAADFSGRHIARGKYEAAQATAYMDETAGTPVASNASIGTSRARIGALSNTSPSNYWQGVMRDVIITGALSASETAFLQQFLLARRVS